MVNVTIKTIAIGYICSEVDMTIRQYQIVIMAIATIQNVYSPTILSRTAAAPNPPLTVTISTIKLAASD